MIATQPRAVLRWFRGALVPILALIFALIVSGIVIAITNIHAPVGAVLAPLIAFKDMARGSFGSWDDVSLSLEFATPLVLTGLSIAFAFRCGLFNIGAEGQYIAGALASTWVAIHWHAPAGLLVPGAFLAGALGGFVWGGIAGLLKAVTGAHEVITTMMMTYIARTIGIYLVDGPWDANPYNPNTAGIQSQAMLWGPGRGPYNLGLNLGFGVALIAVIVFWYVLWRTNVGYRIRAVGFNAKAARYAGMPVNLYIFLSLAIAGAFAGLAGAAMILGYLYSLNPLSLSLGYGIDGIAVAFLGGSTPLGVFLSAILFGAMHQGGTIMQSDGQITVPLQMVQAIEGIVIVFIAAPTAIRFLAGGRHTPLGRFISPDVGVIVDTPAPLEEEEEAVVQHE